MTRWRFLHVLFMLDLLRTFIVDQTGRLIFVSYWGILGQLKEEIFFAEAHILLVL